jgi:saccharopine dehydrogenase (NAD+, L-lysine-forming)
VPVTKWDIEETRAGGPFPEILEHELLLNCVLMTEPTPPFLTLEMLRGDRSLVAIADVACDPNGPLNPLPVYDAPTTMVAPAVRLDVGDPPLAITAIDHLPSLLPRESSADFSQQLLPVLEALIDSDATDRVSARARDHFDRAVAALS